MENSSTLPWPAGVAVSFSSNGTSYDLLLLPGTYVPSRLANTTFPPIPRSGSIDVRPLPGFTSSGSLTSTSFSVSLESGMTAYSGSLFSRDETFYSAVDSVNISLSKSASSDNDDGASPIAKGVGSLVLSDNVFAITKLKDGRRAVLWDSVADFNQVPSSSGGRADILIAQGTGCSGGCGSGGACATGGKCVCKAGFSGSRCGEPKTVAGPGDPSENV